MNVKQGQSQKEAPLRADLQKKRDDGVDFPGSRLQKGKHFSYFMRVISFRILIFDFRKIGH